jgi:tetratricopeptide (TPR) repeat protein
MFLETFFLGTIVVHPETRVSHPEFGVSLLDLDRFVAFFRDHQLARLDDIDIRRYFEAAESDLKAYCSYHMSADILEVDPWRVGDVRLEFEKLRQRFLHGHVRVPLDRVPEAAMSGDAGRIEAQAWAAHESKKWLEAAQRWEVYRERFPNTDEGFVLGSVALIELGRFYEADALLRLAMEKFPDSVQVHNDYALVAQHRHDWRETKARCEAFRAKFPQDKIGYSLGATALCELEQYAEAESLIRQGLEWNPDDEELLEKHAWVAQFSGNEQEALQRWKKLRGEYPNNGTALRYFQEHSLE